MRAGGTIDDRRCLDAITAVVAAQQAHGAAQRDAERRQAEAIATIGRTVAREGAAEYQRLRERVVSRLVPGIDPLLTPWNVFRLFDLSYDETRWTQWLAGVLDREHGPRGAALAWAALCDVVAEGAARRPAVAARDGARIATSLDWGAARDEVLTSVASEVSHPRYGRIDLLLETSSLVVGVENKLWEAWHDQPGEAPQAVRYRELVTERLLERAPGGAMALVLLTCHEDLTCPEDYPADYVCVTWRDFGRSLRRRVSDAWSRSSQSASDVLDLWPLVLTLGSIEQDLLGFDAALVTRADPDVRNLDRLTDLDRYISDL